MEKILFKIVDICQSNRIEKTFVQELQHSGLIDIVMRDEQEYIDEDQISSLQRFTTLHYELDVNIQGIEVVHNLLDRIERLQSEIAQLKTSMK